MGSMLGCIILVLAAVVAAGAGVVALRPADLRVTRRATIAASPAAVFAQVNDFHRWEAWSPWAKRDPRMKATYEGAPAGTGAVYTWAGNREVGEGRMTITESRPHELIRIRLEFMKPFAAINTAEFSFAPDGTGTAVTWTMTGRNGFIGKAIGLVMNMDRMIGGDFEAGLAGIKQQAEAART
jgi:uncharacterized protein YndB with AHSA1/START domain